MNLRIHKAGDPAPHPAVHESSTAQPLGSGGSRGQLHLEAGLFYNLVAQHQNLGQHKHNQEHGDQGAPAEALSNAHDRGLGGDLPDEETRRRQNRAGGEHRREGQVQGLDQGLLGGHSGFQVRVPRGDHDGIVDVRAHLDGGHDQIAHKENIGVAQGREGEVDPDTALNHQDQQNRQPHRRKGKHQYQHHEHYRQHADHHIVPGEGHRLVVVAGGVAHQQHIVRAVTGIHDPVDGLQEGKGLLPLLGQVQIQHHAGVVLPHHLCLGIRDLPVSIVDILLVLFVQGHITLLLLLINKQDHIHGGYGIAVNTAHNGPVVVLLVRRIGGVENAGLLIGQIHHFGELTGGQLIGEVIARLGLHIGQTHGIVHLVHGAQLIQDGLLALRVPLGHHHGHNILAAKGGLYPVGGGLVLIAPLGHHRVVPIHIGALVGQHKTAHNTHRKHRYAHQPQMIHQLAPPVDLGDKILVAGALHSLREQHQQAGHQGEYGQHTQQNGLDKHQPQIEADAELHEHHGGQA